MTTGISGAAGGATFSRTSALDDVRRRHGIDAPTEDLAPDVDGVDRFLALYDAIPKPPEGTPRARTLAGLWSEFQLLRNIAKDRPSLWRINPLFRDHGEEFFWRRDQLLMEVAGMLGGDIPEPARPQYADTTAGNAKSDDEMNAAQRLAEAQETAARLRLQNECLQKCLPLNDAIRTARSAWDKTPAPETASPFLNAEHAAIGAELDAIENMSRSFQALVEGQITDLRLLQIGERNLDATITRLSETNLRASRYRSLKATLQTLRERDAESQAQAGRALADMAEFCAYPFTDPDFARHRARLEEILADLPARLEKTQHRLAECLETGADPNVVATFLADIEATLHAAAPHREAMRDFVRAVKEKLRARFDAIMSRPVVNVFHSLSIAGVRRTLLREMPHAGLYESYYDAEEDEMRFVAKAAVALPLRDLVRILGHLGAALGEELERLKDPVYGFTRTHVITRVSQDIASLAGHVADAFTDDPALMASDEFAAMGRESQITVIRNVLRSLEAAGDAEKLRSFFTDLEIFSAPFARDFWLIDVYKYGLEHGVTLVDDLITLSQGADPAVSACARAFLNGYLYSGNLLRRATRAFVNPEEAETDALTERTTTYNAAQQRNLVIQAAQFADGDTLKVNGG